MLNLIQLELMKTVKFKGWECELIFSKYPNGRTAIQLVDHTSKEPIAVATVNIPEWEPQKNEILIKDWSENKGMKEALRSAGVIIPTMKYVETGFVKADVCVLVKKQESVKEFEGTEVSDELQAYIAEKLVENNILSEHGEYLDNDFGIKNYLEAIEYWRFDFEEEEEEEEEEEMCAVAVIDSSNGTLNIYDFPISWNSVQTEEYVNKLHPGDSCSWGAFDGKINDTRRE